MKKLLKPLCTLYFLLCTFYFTQAQWVNVSPAFSMQFDDIYCPSDDTCFAVGFDLPNTTRVLKTEDGGSTWFAAQSGIPANIDSRSVFCIDNNTCFVGGSGVIYKTINGGNSWYQANVPGGFGTPTPIIFLTDSIGYTGGLSGGNYLKTIDGGENCTWESVPSFGSFMPFFFTEDTGYAIGAIFSGGFLILAAKTTNGGSTWTDISPSLPPNTLGPAWAVYCINDSTCYVIGGGKRIVSTTNSGASWDTIPLNPNFSGYFDIDCIGDTCWITGNGVVLKSSDGINWIPDTVGLSPSGSIVAIHFPSPSVAYVGYTLSTKIYKKGTSVGLPERNRSELAHILYPNPMAGHTTLYLSLNKKEQYKLKLYNLLGKVVRQENVYKGSNLITRDNLEAGMYLYTINSEGAIPVKGKLIVE